MTVRELFDFLQTIVDDADDLYIYTCDSLDLCSAASVDRALYIGDATDDDIAPGVYLDIR